MSNDNINEIQKLIIILAQEFHTGFLKTPPSKKSSEHFSTCLNYCYNRIKNHLSNINQTFNNELKTIENKIVNKIK